MVGSVLKALGVENFFEMGSVRVCRDDVKNTKPSPDGFIRLMTAVDHGAPEKIMYVGDHKIKDVQTSLFCGLQAAHVVYSGVERPVPKSFDINGVVFQYVEIDTIYDLRKVFGC